MSIPWFAININNNLKSTTDVTGSLLDFALSCEQGMTYFRTTNSTTDSPFPFSVGLIYRRNNDFKIVGYDLLGNGIKTNRKTGDMENWDGWHLTALKSDLDLKASITPGYTPFKFRYDNRYPNVLYIHNLETDELYYAELTKNR